jgi:hypothetical protein
MDFPFESTADNSFRDRDLVPRRTIEQLREDPFGLVGTPPSGPDRLFWSEQSRADLKSLEQGSSLLLDVR